MTKQVVIDSSVLVATIDNCDKWHSVANRLIAALISQQIDLIYPDCVLNETIGVLARRTTEQKRAEEFTSLLDDLTELVSPDVITWLSLETSHLYLEIIEVVRQSLGELNFHDALMTMFCRDSGVRAIASFDKDFDRIPWLTRIQDGADVVQLK